ncbi:MAG: hypothetical protein IJM39_08075 [Firmicutes bacterium]|nr:hypothetical protein [Bacillota bacterium]
MDSKLKLALMTAAISEVLSTPLLSVSYLLDTMLRKLSSGKFVELIATSPSAADAVVGQTMMNTNNKNNRNTNLFFIADSPFEMDPDLCLMKNTNTYIDIISRDRHKMEVSYSKKDWSPSSQENRATGGPDPYLK